MASSPGSSKSLGMQVKRIPVSHDISQTAVELVEEFSHSHAMQLADALIAGTESILSKYHY